MMTTCNIRYSISFVVLLVFILVTRVPEDSHGSAVKKKIYCNRNANQCNFDYGEVSMDFDDIPNENSIRKRSIFGPFENAPEKIQNEVRKQWTDFFKEWIPQIRTHTHAHMHKTMEQVCRESRHGSSSIVDCEELDPVKQMLNSACISAVSREISYCAPMKKEDLPIHVCRELESNRLELCGEHISSGLCSNSPRNPEPPIVPCNIPKLSICLQGQYMVYCNERDIDSVRPDEQFQFFVKEWIPPIPDVRVFSTRVHWNDLCYNEENPTVLTVCNKHEACIDVYGTIVNCYQAKAEITHLPLCMQTPNRHLIVCAQDWTAYLCYPVDQTRSEKFTPCNDKYRYICLNEDGKKVHCFHKPVETPGPAADVAIIPPTSPVITTVTTTVATTVSTTVAEEDERFMRIFCDDCSVENELIVIGDPQNVEKEMETITFKPLP